MTATPRAKPPTIAQIRSRALAPRPSACEVPPAPTPERKVFMAGNAPSRVLIWQWARFGAGPRFATLLAEGMSELPGVAVFVSLSRGAEILGENPPPQCDLPVDTYSTFAGFVVRLLSAPLAVPGLARRIRALRPDLAVCAQPGPLDLLMAAALRWLKIPFVVVVHDADAHPGDGFPLQMWLQRALCRAADIIACLTTHVGDRLLRQKLAGSPAHPLIRLRHPPMRYEFASRPDDAGGTFRLLSFGRLLPYKGLDLLANSLRMIGPRAGLSIRIVGSGPESAELAALRELPGVTVENRWVPESEVGALFGWADAVVLPYREASQSGVAAVALAANRYVVATNVGGLAEQLRDEPLVIMCEPDADSLAAGLRRVLDTPRCETAAPPAAGNDWREVARSLLDQAGAQRLAAPAA
jgi:glycosyltransferase involved in cell wall biosynthesis